jgi:hypothetical protein
MKKTTRPAWRIAAGMELTPEAAYALFPVEWRK